MFSPLLKPATETFTNVIKRRDYTRRDEIGNLIYLTNSSVDGYTEDRDGKFDWAEPDDEVHRFVNDLERSAGIHLYGRRMYETMAVWETDPSLAAMSPIMRDYAGIWQAADKIVYSRTLPAAHTARTRIEREFDPEAIKQLKQTSARDISIGGPELAGQAFKFGLIDECHLLLWPVVVGGGKPAFPSNTSLNFKLLEERRFENGTAFLRYQTQS